MTTATNDACTKHDLDRDVHDRAPTDCRACVPVFPMAKPFACLSHTCPDCGSIVHALTNDRGELIHDCPPECLSAVLGPILDADGNCKCCGEKWDD